MDVPAQNDQAITRGSLYGTAAESTYAGITSFMRRRYSRDLRGVDVAVSGVPFDTATSNRPGARFDHGASAPHPPELPGNATGRGRLTRSIIWRSLTLAIATSITDRRSRRRNASKPTPNTSSMPAVRC